MEFEKWIELGKQLGLKGADLATWVVQQQRQAVQEGQEERALAREKRQEERALAREKRQKERVAAKEAVEREIRLLQLMIQFKQTGSLSRASSEHLEVQEEQQKCEVPVEVAHGKCEEIARTVLPIVVREAKLCEPNKGDARSADRGVVVEGPVDGDLIERDVILCQENAREAASMAVDDLTQLSREFVANVAPTEVVRSDANVLGKGTSGECHRSEKCAEAQCRQDSGVGDSAQVGELRCDKENSCITPRFLELSDSTGGFERGELPANHQDRAVEVEIVTDDIRAGHHEEPEEGLEISTAKRARRKKRRRKVRNAAEKATQPRKTKGAKPCGERSEEFRKVRLQIAMSPARARPNRRVKKQGKSRSSRGRPKARVPLCSPSFGSLKSVHGMAQKIEPIWCRELGIRVSKVAVRCVKGMLPVRQVSRVGSEENGRCTFCIPSLTRPAVKPRPPRVRLKDVH